MSIVMSIHVQEYRHIKEKGILLSTEQEPLISIEQEVQVMLVPDHLHIHVFLPEQAQETSQVITLVTTQDHSQVSTLVDSLVIMLGRQLVIQQLQLKHIHYM